MATNWRVLIQVREHERDLQMQRLAQANRHLRDCESACEAARHSLRRALEEARGGGTTGTLDVRRLTAEREYITRLQIGLEQCEITRAEAAAQGEAERRLLLAAEQRLEQLERLAQQQLDAAAAQNAKRQQRELEEIWQASQAHRRSA
jgi:flagellar export protein FliJ